jgi:hypothetical protein
MKNTVHHCIDCGSLATHSIIDEIRPIFRIEQFHFPCGAVLESSYGARGQVGKISHEGCRTEEETNTAEG